MYQVKQLQEVAAHFHTAAEMPDQSLQAHSSDLVCCMKRLLQVGC